MQRHLPTIFLTALIALWFADAALLLLAAIGVVLIEQATASGMGFLVFLGAIVGTAASAVAIAGKSQ